MAPTMSWRMYLLIHSVILSWYVFTLSANCSLKITGRHPGAKSYGGRWKYLTFLNLVMQTIFFGLCVLIDLFHLILPARSLNGGLAVLLVKLRDIIYTVLAFPIGTFVFVSFWSLYTYDRDLVYPKYLDDIIPVWLNHAMHTVIVPLVMVQMYIQHHKYPSRFKGILGLALFAALYLAWVLWVHHVAGIWVYPIMAQLSPVGLFLFLGVACLSMAPLYLLGEYLNRKIWGSTGGTALKHGTQKKKRK
ncbi:androgen dependent TFPI regulating protein 1 [Hypomesus transpacificus]|uniref:androgen dependent TFPI regulating protein 1 n=1 Tax=Hypomesus transpacificus TaxID=137520 RepID=UPI001F085181|nr:androgen dependent TFPI regulating protein 1 [Hypomesus transpacificus]